MVTKKTNKIFSIILLVLIALVPFTTAVNVCQNFNNDYAIAASSFVKEKCYDCQNVIIIGDDYVVPSYRRNLLFANNPLTSQTSNYISDTIITDSSYIPRTTKLFSEFDNMFKLDNKYQGKDVVIILPNRDDAQKFEFDVNETKKVLEVEGYKPNFKQDIYGTHVTCDRSSFYGRQLVDKTLIIIGTEETNNALKCYNLFSTDDTTDSILMEKNQWDLEEDAFIIYTDDVDLLKSANNLIADKEIKKLKGYSAYVIKVTSQVVSNVAFTIALAAFMASGAGLVTVAVAGTITAVASTVDAIDDGTQVVNDCFVNKDGIGNCAFSISLIFLPGIIDEGAKGIKRALGPEFSTRFTKYVGTLSSRAIRNAEFLRVEYFPKDVFKKIYFYGTEDFIKGLENIFGDTLLDIDRFTRKVRVSNKLNPELISLHQKVTQSRFIVLAGRLNQNIVRQFLSEFSMSFIEKIKFTRYWDIVEFYWANVKASITFNDLKKNQLLTLIKNYKYSRIKNSEPDKIMGNFGESIVNFHANQRGLSNILDGKKLDYNKNPYKDNMDHIFYDSKNKQYVIVETKYSSTPDRKIIELKDKNLGVDKEGNFQLSNNWIDFNIKKMKDSGIPEYEQVADILEKNKNNIRKEYYLVHGNKKISGNTFNDDLVKKNLDTTISGKHYTKDQTPGVDRVNIIELGYEVFENDIK